MRNLEVCLFIAVGIENPYTASNTLNYVFILEHLSFEVQPTSQPEKLSLWQKVDTALYIIEPQIRDCIRDFEHLQNLRMEMLNAGSTKEKTHALSACITLADEIASSYAVIVDRMNTLKGYQQIAQSFDALIE